MKGIALMGTHRVGKTTLAKTYADKYHMDLIHCSVSPAYIKCGYLMGSQLSMTHRINVQETALKMYQDTFDNQLLKGVPYITDRCFLDLIGYTLADYREEYQTESWFMNYVQRCIDLTELYFSKVILIRPGVKINNCETSWSGEYGIVSKVDACMLWAAEKSEIVTQLKPSILTLDKRIEFIEQLLENPNV